MKLQPEPSGVDHMIHGATVAEVDLRTGALGPGRRKQDPAIAHHVLPGREWRFVGYRVPYWAEARALALQAAAAFPWARVIGWDVAVSDAGPVLIEGNHNWSAELSQVPASRGVYHGEFKALVDALRRNASL